MVRDMLRQVQDLFRRDDVVRLGSGRGYGRLLCLRSCIAFQPFRGLMDFSWIGDVVVPLMRSVNEPEDKPIGVKLVLLVRARCRYGRHEVSLGRIVYRQLLVWSKTLWYKGRS